jgi:hypothetical protein
MWEWIRRPPRTAHLSSDPNTGFTSANALSATPYIYLIPAGEDTMRAPPLGDVYTRGTWAVEDRAIPLPFNIANTDFSTNRSFISGDSISEPAYTVRKHQAFRAVPDHHQSCLAGRSLGMTSGAIGWIQKRNVPLRALQITLQNYRDGSQ